MNNNKVFESTFFKGFAPKSGKLTFLDTGDVYQGELDEFKMHGMGVMRFANGDIYDGSWQNGQRHGYGAIQYANGNMYIGKWLYDKRSGHGKEVTADKGEFYEGNFLLNQK